MMSPDKLNQVKESNQQKVNLIQEHIKTVQQNIVAILKCVKEHCMKVDQVFVEANRVCVEATNQRPTPEGMNDSSDVLLSSTMSWWEKVGEIQNFLNNKWKDPYEDGHFTFCKEVQRDRQAAAKVASTTQQL